MYEQKAGDAGRPARFSPLRIVARALGARPAGETEETTAPEPPATHAAPAAIPTDRATAVSGEDFLAVVNAMMADNDDAAEDATFDLVALVGDAHEIFAPDAAARGVTLALAVATGAHGTYGGDIPRVRHVLLNLVAAALKTFTDTVELTADWRDEAVTFRLNSPETAVAMVRLQADAEPPGRRRAAAHRLWLARTSAASLGGEVRVAPGEGVEAVLPLRRVETMGAETTAPTSAPAPRIGFKPLPAVETIEAAAALRAAPQAPLPTFTPVVEVAPAVAPGLRILVAEENPAHQQMLRALLDGMGAKAVVVGDPQQVVTAWRQESWDVLLIDIEGDGIAGRSLARSLRAAEAAARWPRTPILALAAHTRERDLDEAFAADIDGLVRKPFHAAGLGEAIGRAVGAQAAPADAAIPIGFMRRA